MDNLRADVFLPLSEGHLMWTDARLERDTGFLLAKTRIQSVVKLAGFHGAAQVVLLNAHQEVLARSDMHTWGVDGVWIGTNDRTEVWSHSFDPDTVRQATALGVLHTWDPQWLSSINNTIAWTGRVWNAVKEWFESEGKGGGDTGGDDTISWPQAGWPWTDVDFYRASVAHIPRVGYTIDVFTGSRSGAGTDANVYITLHGSKGSSTELQLDNDGEDNFERGKMDSFSVQLPELDEIQRLQIRHDNSGGGSGWFLDKIVVRRDDTKQEWPFECGRWLAWDEDDKAIDRELIKS
ncbi:PLAT/LH2 domain-containing protein [Streptomyces sp. cg35]|uniref:PLAT/LH2 domain-containing protein n=1 Tax=Streptomyces sp. cg35 TaxID=3421650 RepID=UPI003D16EE6E